MKTFNKITASLFVLGLLLGFTACTEKVAYDPAEIPGGAQVYFPSSLSSTVALSQDLSVTSYDIPLSRLDKSNALTVNLIVQNDNPDIFSIPATASFAAGAESTKITITYDPTKLDYDVYKPITITISDESVTSPYGSSVYAFKAGIPAPWKSLGKATFTDTWLFSNSYSIEIQQNELDPTLFRLVDPYTPGLTNPDEGFSSAQLKGDQSPYLQFQVLPAGSVYKNVTTTVDGLVVYGDINTGFYNTSNSYNTDVWVYHPSRFTTMPTENFWIHNIVLQYQANGLPALVQLAPYYYMPGLGGWNQTQNDGVVTILFPGVVLTSYDYSISLGYLGHYIDVDGVDNAIVQITKGADAASYKYVVVDGALSAASAATVADEIIAGTIASEEDTQSAYKIFPLENAGKYTVVAVTFDQDGKAQESGFVTFEFAPAGASDPWVSLGFCKYTDDAFVTLYSDDVADIPTYDVEILQNKDTPGLFRLKNAYGAGYPYNDPGDYDPGNVYIEINATDPDGVFIDYQSMGVNWGDGNAYIYSYASYMMDKGSSFADVKAAGYCGTYKNNVITFPVKRLLVTFEGSSSLYYANNNGLWKVDMTSLHASPAKNAASLRSSLSRSFSQGKAPFSFSPIQPVRVEGKNMPAPVIRKNMKIASTLVY